MSVTSPRKERAKHLCLDASTITYPRSVAQGSGLAGLAQTSRDSGCRSEHLSLLGPTCTSRSAPAVESRSVSIESVPIAPRQQSGRARERLTRTLR